MVMVLWNVSKCLEGLEMLMWFQNSIDSICLIASFANTEMFDLENAAFTSDFCTYTRAQDGLNTTHI